jgi:hypothetical protein
MTITLVGLPPRLREAPARDIFFVDGFRVTGDCFRVKQSRVHPLFKNMPGPVQGLRKQAEQEQREKARQEFWRAQQNAGPGYKPLPASTKVK